MPIASAVDMLTRLLLDGQETKGAKLLRLFEGPGMLLEACVLSRQVGVRVQAERKAG